ncbi:MAG: carboxyltransferase domain-containing protein [Pseudomonadota bacterium]
MRTRVNLKRTGDDLFEFDVETPSIAQAVARQLRREGLAEDVVAGLASVAVRFHPSRAADIQAWLNEGVEAQGPDPESGEVLEITVRYGGKDGPDLQRICDQLDLTCDALIAMHTGRVHTVEMMGFTPGFSYLSGLPEGLKIPRLDEPRPRVAAGAVGLSADYTGLYALAGPGGWPLIGRTVDTLFVSGRQEPFLLEPGLRVTFRSA